MEDKDKKKKENPEIKKPEPSKDISDDMVSAIFDKKTDKKETPSIFGIPLAKKEISKVFLPKEMLQAKSFDVSQSKYKTLPFGIDVGTDSIKVIQLVTEDKTLKVSKWLIKDSSYKMKDKEVVKEKFLEFIRKTLIDNRLKGKAYISISSREVLTHYFSLPKMPLSEVKKAVTWELKQRYRELLDESIMDYVILNEKKVDQDRQLEVMSVLAVKKDMVKYVDVFRSAGIQPLGIEVDIFSLVANINYFKLINPDEVVLFLDFGSRVSMFYVIVNQCIHFTRPMNTSKSRFIRATEDYFRIPHSEAVDLINSFIAKIGHQADEKVKTYDGEKLKELFKEVYIPFFQKTVLDVDRIFKYYSFQKTKSRVSKFDRIILHGGLVALPMLYEYFSDYFDVPILLVNSCANIPLKKKNKNVQRQWDACSFRFPVAIGAALRYFDEDKKEK
ncbi:MAG: pilus assembly protein PilM [Candidatus Omnitrophica bacterium]|nr:pilus assembly protein PilM [Candidatus Omnitrophota bacterium]